MKTVFLIVRNVADELRASDFEPVSFELGFGARGTLPPVEVTVDGVTLSVSGFVDRVDGWERDGKLYLRVVDYKTGAKSFDFTDIWNGMGMQTLLYLFALQGQGRTLYGATTLPAGALYLPARETILSGSRSADPESLRKQADRELVRKGLLLGSPEVLNAMEHMDENGPRFLPVKLSPKTGGFAGDALATAEEFGRLARHLEGQLCAIGREIAAGCIDADPYVRGARSACAWCEFAGACHFDEDCGDRRRYLPTLRAAEFWEKIKEEDAR
jgi:ATP-dependent helicase/nuclease subunit B